MFKSIYFSSSFHQNVSIKWIVTQVWRLVHIQVIFPMFNQIISSWYPAQSSVQLSQLHVLPWHVHEITLKYYHEKKMFDGKNVSILFCQNFSRKMIVTHLWRLIQIQVIFPMFTPAPEIQHKSQCSSASDMFSFGMLMISVFNGGNSLIQAGYSTNAYFKQAGVVSTSLNSKCVIACRRQHWKGKQKNLKEKS